MVICGELWGLEQRKFTQILRWFLTGQKKKKKQRNLNAGADILIKWDRGIAGRSCPMRRMTLEKTRKQKRGIQRRVGFPT